MINFIIKILPSKYKILIKKNLQNFYNKII